MRDENREERRWDLPGDAGGALEALLAGSDPRSLRNAGIVIDVAFRQPERRRRSLAYSGDSLGA